MLLLPQQGSPGNGIIAMWFNQPGVVMQPEMQLPSHASYHYKLQCMAEHGTKCMSDTLSIASMHWMCVQQLMLLLLLLLAVSLSITMEWVGTPTSLHSRVQLPKQVSNAQVFCAESVVATIVTLL